MIDYIKRKLRIGRYNDQVVNMERERIKTALLELKRTMDAGNNWEHIWMCCTEEAMALDVYVKKTRGITLMQLNKDFGKRCYGLEACKLFPVHNVVTLAYNTEVNARHTYDAGSKESILMATVRKELFNYWCNELIGEHL